MRRPEISIVIPTHDRREQMLRTLAGALAQEDIDLEVIVVDDGSSDGTAAALARIVDVRLRVIRLAPAHGVARARNAGIAEARGEWIAFLDDDDLWAPRKLRTQLDGARAQGVGAVYCGAARVTLRGEFIEALDLPAADRLEPEMYRRNPLPSGPSNVIARTALVRSVGGFDAGFSLLADWDMWLMLLRVTRFGAVPEVLVGYVDHGGSMTRSGSESAAREYRDLVAKHSGPGATETFRPLIYLQWRARVHRKAGRRFRAAGLYLRTGLTGHPPDLVRSLALVVGDTVYERARRARRVPSRSAGPVRAAEAHDARDQFVAVAATRFPPGRQ